MAHTVIIHITNEEPIVGELEQLPAATDTIINIQNPRRRDGKDVQNLSAESISVIWPINQILFIEILPGEGEEHIIGFVRD
jgi:hypothetical protein